MQNNLIIKGLVFGIVSFFVLMNIPFGQSLNQTVMSEYEHKEIYQDIIQSVRVDTTSPNQVSDTSTNITRGDRSNQSWWNFNWLYCRVLPITNPSNSYQMKIIVGKSQGGDVNSAGHCNDDFSDVRFIDIDNTTELSYWLENYTVGNQATFWVKSSLDIETDGAIVLYYGNSNAPLASNGNTTFLTFINDTTGWVGNTEILSMSDGRIKMYSSPGWNSCFHPISTGGNSDITIDIKIEEIQVPSPNINYLGLTVTDGFDVYHYFADMVSAQDYDGYFYTSNENSYTLYTPWAEQTNREWRTVIKTSTETIDYYLFEENGSLLASAINQSYAFPTPNTITHVQLSASIYRWTNAYISWITVRKYVASEPLWEIPGEEQSLPTPDTVYVDDDFNSSTPGWGYDHFSNIQAGIDTVDFNGTVFVFNGIYYENLLIEKNYLRILGENKNTTIIDVNDAGNVITIQNQYNYEYNGKYNVISGFTLRNAGGAGVYIHDVGRHGPPHPEFNTISDCLIYNCAGSGIYLYSDHEDVEDQSFLNCSIFNNSGYGIEFVGRYQNHDTISGCQIYNNQQGGIYLGGAAYPWGYSGQHIVRNNSCYNNNGIGISITADNFGNIIYHNNFYNNTQNAYDYGSDAFWFNTTIQEGNYWSDYTGTDGNGDGIGDTPYNIPGENNQDLYPFMYPHGWSLQPLAYWHFNEGIGDIAYDSSGENDATIYGASWIDGVSNTGLLFDGIDDYVEVPPISDLINKSLNAISFECWVYLYENSSLPQQIIEGHTIVHEINLERLAETSIIQFDIVDDDGILHHITTSSLNKGVWHHLVATINDTSQCIYVDGVLNNASTWTNLFTITTGFMMGRDYEQAGQYLNGKLDEFRIYSRGLNQEEIVDHYQQYAPSFPKIIYVDDDNIAGPWDGSIDNPYQHIQQGINVANPGDTVFVFNGNYLDPFLIPEYAYLYIEKSINLIGENKDTTIVNCPDQGNTGGETGILVGWHGYAVVSDVTISGFTFHGGHNSGSIGIYVQPHGSDIRVENCIVDSFADGVSLVDVTNCLVWNCTFYDNSREGGIDINGGANANHIIKDCTSYSNSYGIHVEEVNSCIIYHNNLFNNTINAYETTSSNILWYNSTLQEGNYYDDYTGEDNNHDGIGDTPYNISGGSNQDLYPLMRPWGENYGIYKAGILGFGANSDNYNPVVIRSVDGNLITILSYDETQTLYSIAHPSTPADWEIIKDITRGTINYNHPDGIYLNGYQDEEYMALYPSGITEENYTVMINGRFDRDIQYSVAVFAIVFNYEDRNNYYRAELTECPDPYFTVWKFVNGTGIHVCDYYHIPMVSGVTYDLKIKVSNSEQQVKVYINNGVWNYTINISEQPPVPAADVYVDDDFNSSTPGWGYDHFSSIQAGIDAVDFNGTVFVSSGTYTEELGSHLEYIRIDKSLTLKGENRGNTIINCPGGEAGVLISVTSSGVNHVNISGFTVQGAHQVSIGIYANPNCDYVRIEDCIVHSFSEGISCRFGCSNITIRNCESYDNNRNGGISFSETDYKNIIISDCVVYNNSNGITANNIVNCIIKNITSYSNYPNVGIFLGASENGTISDCRCYDNHDDGIRINSCNDCYVLNCDVYNNGDDGIDLSWAPCVNNIISGNNCTNNRHGIILYQADNNYIYENNLFSNSGFGIYPWDSSYNLISHNNLNNTNNAQDENTNLWYNVTIQEGNHWSDYTGEDTDGDGIGDTPYIVSGGSNQDLYPLISTYGPPHANFTFNINDKAVSYNASSSFDYNGIITDYLWQFGDGTNGTGVLVNHLYPDYGTYAVTLTVIDNDDEFNTTTKYVSLEDLIPPLISDVTLITSEPLDTDPAFGWINITCTVTDNHDVSDVRLNITCPDGSTTNISMNAPEGQNYSYNTTFTQYGNYHYFIWASDTYGNTCTSGNYEFIMPPNWDISIDGECNLLDLILISNHYTETGSSGWLREDVNNDGIITILDLAFVSNHYDEQWLQEKNSNNNCIGSTLDDTIISIYPPNQTVSYGENFTVSVYFASGQPIKGWESRLSFNASLIQVNTVTEGDFFDGYTTFFNPGTFNNTDGTIVTLYDFIVGAGNVSDPGTFITISCTAGSIAGTSSLNLYNVGVCNETSYVPIAVSNGYVEVVENNPPYTPNAASPPNDATGVDVDANLSWLGGDPDPEDTVTYDVYFGISSNPPQVTDNQSGLGYTPGVLAFNTTYYWKIVAWDNHGASTTGPLWHFTTETNTPPNAPLINGPTSGKPGETYTYTFVAVDPDDDTIYYEINWGDGQVDDWFGPCTSNLVITRTHQWNEKGTYIIQARAKDVHGAIGEWGSLSVTMPMDLRSAQSQVVSLPQLIKNGYMK